MHSQCPACHSTRISTLHTAKKVGGLVGSSFGIVRTILTRSPSIPLIMTGLTLGMLIGDLLDQQFLPNRKCLHCGHTFSDEYPLPHLDTLSDDDYLNHEQNKENNDGSSSQ